MIFVVFMTLAGVTLWASILAFFEFSSGRVRNLYFACLMVAMMAAFWTTFRFNFDSPDGNTHVSGWPVPMFILQKQIADESRKTIGGVSVLAFPLNFFLYMLVPSVAVLIIVAVARFRRREHRCS